MSLTRLRRVALQPRAVVVVILTHWFSGDCHAQFGTIINVPPDVPPKSIDSNTQLNVLEGGDLPSTFQMPFQIGLEDGSSTNVELSVSGGTVGDAVQANSGSELNISGGAIGSHLEVHSGASANIAGGTVGHAFRAMEGSNLTLSGGEFLLNGNAVQDGLITLTDFDVFSGTFADGSPFIFSPLAFDRLDSALLTIAKLPPRDSTPITVDSEEAPAGLRSGQTLTLVEGGILPENFAAVNATLNTQGGRVGDGLEMVGTHAQISGALAGDIRAFSDSVVTVLNSSAGRISASTGSRVNVASSQAESLVADKGGILTITDGLLDFAGAEPGGLLEISGGKVHYQVYAEYGSEVVISGGDFNGSVDLYGSNVSISGGSFPGVTLEMLGLGEHRNVVHISGGTFSADASLRYGGRLLLNANSELYISGGSIDRISTADWGSNPPRPGHRKLDIAGGAIGSLQFVPGEALAQFTIHGGGFRLDGIPIKGLENIGDQVLLEHRTQGTLTGILADGTPIYIGGPGEQSSEIAALGNVTLQLASLPPVGPTIVHASTDDVPWGIREGQTLVVDGGGVLHNNFVAGMGSSVQVDEGGSVGNNMEAIGAKVTISGGTVGHELGIFDQSQLLVAGGEVGRSEVVNSQVTITGGAVNVLDAWSSDIRVLGGDVRGVELLSGPSRLMVSGGTVRSIDISSRDNGLMIFGGTIEQFEVGAQNHVSIYGTRFRLSGAVVSDSPGLRETITITDRDVRLTGNLADGSRFNFPLSTAVDPEEGFINPEATLTVTYVSLLQGDYNSDGQVDQGDLDLVLLNWGKELVNPFATGWINDLPHGAIDQAELNRVLLTWGSSVAQPTDATSVPEPFGLNILVAAVSIAILRRVKKRVGHKLQSLILSRSAHL